MKILIEDIQGNELHPKLFFPVGDYLLEELQERNVSLEELAKGLRVDVAELNDIIDGARSITPLLAAKMERFMGISAEYWLSLQAAWEVGNAKKQLVAS